MNAAITELEAAITKSIQRHLKERSADAKNWGQDDLAAQIRQSKNAKTLAVRVLEGDEFNAGGQIGRAMLKTMMTIVNWESVQQAIAADIDNFRQIAKAEIQRQDEEDAAKAA